MKYNRKHIITLPRRPLNLAPINAIVDAPVPPLWFWGFDLQHQIKIDDLHPRYYLIHQTISDKILQIIFRNRPPSMQLMRSFDESPSIALLLRVSITAIKVLSIKISVLQLAVMLFSNGLILVADTTHLMAVRRDPISAMLTVVHGPHNPLANPTQLPILQFNESFFTAVTSVNPPRKWCR
eukprot:TRINITY_DN5032_c0_g3_i2.p2 TRINITY_DN5032_c0_g3~~TRINITY_DN5032_c0_g3_i2.p2  ORF type:complete len:181 (-),score=6.95 TRINITY_DN5032_c0_g3_i2:380-922(-)